MSRVDGALVGTKKPALDQCGNAVNTRQRFMSRNFGSKDDMRIVLKPNVLQRCVNCRSVSAHSATWCDVFLYKGNDHADGGRRNASKTNTPEALGLMYFNGNGDRNQMAAVLRFCARGPGIFRISSAQRQKDLIDLDGAAQQVAIGTDHRTAKAVQHGPCGLVAIQAEYPLQSESTDALLLICDVPSRSEPHPQRRTGLVKYRSCRHAALVSATSANQSTPSSTPGIIYRAARRAAKSFRPSQALKVCCAGILSGKPVLKFNPVAWVILVSNWPSFIHN